MKKLKIILALLSILVVAAKAQQKPINQSVDSKGNFIRYSASSFGHGIGVSIGIDKNTKWIEDHNMVANQPNNNYVFSKGTKKITVFGYIPKDSADYYRFNIIEDYQSLETNAVPYIKGSRPFRDNIVEINLGTFNIENKKLIIESYKVTAPRQIKTVTIYNKEIEPAKILTITRGVTDKRGSGTMMENLQNGFKFKINDTSTVTSLHVVLKPTDVPFLYTVYIKNRTTGKTELVSNNWLYTGFMEGNKGSWWPLPNMKINASFFNEPGDYELQIVPKLPGGFRIKAFPEKTTTFRFTILPSDPVLQQKTVIRYVAMGLAIIACLVFIVFYTIRMRNKKLLAEQKQQKDMAQLQLDAVRSQLNPHFLFNALAGIQNLMNKTDIDQANRYLTKFARLTRNVLNNNDLINLSEEKTLLDDYLQMEQMRFGFDFEISIDPNLDISNIQIPSMLLHPFVENAVKHGLPSEERTGKITISISKKDNDLELTIADNGKGFNDQNDGLGLQLSKKRIALLKTIYKDSPIQLDVQSGANGTMITITLKHWL
jgi:two-component system, LytTR family, sensor kinase